MEKIQSLNSISKEISILEHLHLTPAVKFDHSHNFKKLIFYLSFFLKRILVYRLDIFLEFSGLVFRLAAVVVGLGVVVGRRVLDEGGDGLLRLGRFLKRLHLLSGLLLLHGGVFHSLQDLLKVGGEGGEDLPTEEVLLQQVGAELVTESETGRLIKMKFWIRSGRTLGS